MVAAAGCRPVTGHNVAVVLLALLFIAEDGVGFRDFGESLACIGVIAVDVWVSLSREGIEALLDIGSGCVGRQPKDIIVRFLLAERQGCGEGATW